MSRARRSRWQRPWIRTVVLGAAVVVLTLHAAAAIALLWVLPQGAESMSPAWVTNVGLPIAIAVGITLVLLAFVFLERSPLGVSLLAAAIAGGWLGASLAGALLFPTTIGVARAIGPGAIGLSLAALAWATRLRLPLSLAFLFLGGVAGAAEIATRRAAPPATRPSGGELANVEGSPAADDAAAGQVSFPCGKEHVRVAPVLAAEGVSVDGAWPALGAGRAPARRSLEAFSKDKSGFRARYAGDVEATLVATKDLRGLDIEAVTTVPRALHAERALFTVVHVPFVANVTLAAIGKAPLPASDRGVRAWQGRDLALHVSRPLPPGPLRPAYEELVSAPLGRDEPLVLEIAHPDPPAGAPKRDASATSCRLVFKDFTAQLSTARSTIASPVAENAITVVTRADSTVVTLALAEGPPPAAITLATGTYRNRIRVDTTMQSPAR